jgi:predicted MFS family arabinose efflux permease
MSIHACYMGSRVVVSLLALKLGASPMLIGVLVAFYALAPMLMGVYAGRLADRKGMRIPLFIGSICTAVAMFCGYFWQQLPGLFATALLMGVAFVFHNVSIQNLTGSYGHPERQSRNFSSLTISYSVSTFFGSVIAGFSIDYAGFGWAFLSFALLTILPITMLIFCPQFARSPNQSENVDKSERRALDLLRDPPLRRFVVMSGLMTAAYELYGFYMPIHAHSAGLSASAIGMILATYAIATFISRFLLPFITRRMLPNEVMFWFMLLSAFGFLFLPVLNTFYLLALASFFVGIGSGVGPPLSMMMSYNRSPPGRTGEVTGLRLTVNNISRVVIPLVTGTLGAALGSAPVFWMNAGILATISWLSRR